MRDGDHLLHEGWWEIREVEVSDNLLEHIVEVELRLVMEHGLILLEKILDSHLADGVVKSFEDILGGLFISVCDSEEFLT